MADSRPRKAEVQRWQAQIASHLEDFPRQYEALDSAMAAFGDDFDLKRFKAAYETRIDMESYNRVQALERAMSRVQNYVADLSITGTKLASLESPEGASGGAGERAFAALREAGVIDRSLERRLVRAQGARSMIEHDYVKVPAERVHQAAKLVRASSLRFIERYRKWIEPYLIEKK